MRYARPAACGYLCRREDKRQRVYRFIRKLTGEGRQVYIVCPRVEEGEEEGLDLMAANEYAKHLQEEVFPDLRVSLHAREDKAEGKGSRHESLCRGREPIILVATTVVEVGHGRAQRGADGRGERGSASACPSCTSCGAAWAGGSTSPTAC